MNREENSGKENKCGLTNYNCGLQQLRAQWKELKNNDKFMGNFCAAVVANHGVGGELKDFGIPELPL